MICDKREDKVLAFIAKQECKLGSITKKAYATSQKFLPRRKVAVSQTTLDVLNCVTDLSEFTTAQDLPNMDHGVLLNFLLKSVMVKNIAIRGPGDKSETFASRRLKNLSQDSVHETVTKLIDNGRLHIDASKQASIASFLSKCCPEDVTKLMVLQHRSKDNLEKLISKAFEDSKPFAMIGIHTYGTNMIAESTLDDIETRKNYIFRYFLSNVDLISLLQYTPYCCLLAKDRGPDSSTLNQRIGLSKHQSKSSKVFRAGPDLKTKCNDRRPDIADFRIMTKSLMDKAAQQTTGKVDTQQKEAAFKAKVGLLMSIDPGDLRKALAPKLRDTFFEQYQTFKSLSQALRHVNNASISLKMVSGKSVKTNALLHYYDLRLMPLSSSNEALVDSQVRPSVVIATDCDLRELVMHCFTSYLVKHQAWNVLKSPCE